eukprot:310992-Prorocentrum_minimum.AAC.1
MGLLLLFVYREHTSMCECVRRSVSDGLITLMARTIPDARLPRGTLVAKFRSTDWLYSGLLFRWKLLGDVSSLSAT